MKKCSATIKLRTPKAKVLEAAITPDNSPAPPGLEISCKAVSEHTLECRVSISCNKPRDILTLRNTLDDLLSALKVAIETLKAVGEPLSDGS